MRKFVKYPARDEASRIDLDPEIAEETRLEHVARGLSGRYTIERELGRGGMATVYLAEDVKHGRKVAIKVLHPQVKGAVEAERFLREIKISASLTHPNILPLHESGETRGFLYFVMPYVEGESLRVRLRREAPLPVEEAVGIAAEVADALNSAHRRGIVHRDIKPENILFEEGHAIIADFGIARAVTAVGQDAVDEDNVTKDGLPLGTPWYMSPEQIRGSEAIDGRSDLYSLACVLYEMLAGRPPFGGEEDHAACLARHLVDAPPSIVAVRPEVPKPVEAAVMRALAKSPAERFQTTDEFGEALLLYRSPEAAARSIAVLPFMNMGSDPEDEFLSDGIAEEIINALTRVSGLEVASRTSTFAFKGEATDIRAIGKQLNVGAVLEGSVRRAGDQLRITVQLINVQDGYHLWSERYDRLMKDVFAIQDEIADNVVRALRLILSDSDRQSLVKVPTSSIEAYELYLRGRQFFHRFGKKWFEFARQMFVRAIEIDPDFALAHAGVASCRAFLVHLYGETDDAVLEEAERASHRALALDPDLPEGHAALGFTLWQMELVDEANEEFEAALQLDPSQFEACYFYARACYQQGKLEHAVRLFEQACRAREHHEARYFAGQTYLALGRQEEAEAAFRRALPAIEKHLELNPDDARAVTMGSVALSRLGEHEAGMEWAGKALAIDPTDAGICYNVACLYAVEGDADRAIACLEDAVRAGFAHRDWVENDPDLDSLREDPRFQALSWPE
jgi:serine/threonine protein kinase/tetratricopeptide (TPR) repeat protein